MEMPAATTHFSTIARAQNRRNLFRWRGLTEITCFDIVSVRVEHESGIIIIAILPAESRRSIILTARFERGAVKLMYGLFARSTQCHMNRLNFILHHNPE